MDSIISGLQSALAWVLQLLPDSPFRLINNSDVSDYISGLNWVLPLDQIVAELEIWVVCVSVYYAYQVILRWIRAIQ